MFDHILEDYLEQLTATGRSYATQRAIHSDLTQFSTWWEHTHHRSFDLTQVVERDLRAWKVARQQVDGAAPATINRESRYFEESARLICNKLFPLSNRNAWLMDAVSNTQKGTAKPQTVASATLKVH